MDSVIIDGVKFVRENTDKDGLPYVVVRCKDAGVHIGYLKEKKPYEVILVNSRRLWSWSGACSLSQVALDGVDINNSRVAMALPSITLAEWIEIIPASEQAKKCIEGAPTWKK